MHVTLSVIHRPGAVASSVTLHACVCLCVSVGAAGTIRAAPIVELSTGREAMTSANALEDGPFAC